MDMKTFITSLYKFTENNNWCDLSAYIMQQKFILYSIVSYIIFVLIGFGIGWKSFKSRSGINYSFIFMFLWFLLSIILVLGIIFGYIPCFFVDVLEKIGIS